MPSPDAPHIAYAGSRTTRERNARGEGLGVYRVDPGAAAWTREGAGPRHIAFHPSNRFAYVVNELDSTVTACRFDDGTGCLTPFQVLSALPDSFVSNSRAAGIAVTAEGRLAHAGWHATGGRTPRFLTLGPADRTLFAANEDSDTIAGFRVDPRTGGLEPTGTVARTGSPVCILFNPLGGAAG